MATVSTWFLLNMIFIGSAEITVAAVAIYGARCTMHLNLRKYKVRKHIKSGHFKIVFIQIFYASSIDTIYIRSTIWF